jgi:hypothetical protein
MTFGDVTEVVACLGRALAEAEAAPAVDQPAAA